MKDLIYTIGYSSFNIEDFINTVKSYNITAIVDVRSSPYSKFKPEFNREKFKESLKENNIEYVFLGQECGARIEAAECYKDGRVDFSLVSNNAKFISGLSRIKNGMKNYTIALMCAEKDPLVCHRTILISRNLIKHNIIIKHILDSLTYESHKDVERRLLKKYKLDQPEMFRSEQQRLDDAYERQGKKIAYGKDIEEENK